jgi:hypothetical protein
MRNDEPNFRLSEDNSKHYGAIVLDPDLTVNCMFAFWDQTKQNLFIYNEVFAEKPDCDLIVQNIIVKMGLRNYFVDKIFGNKELFSEFKRSVQKEFNRAFETHCPNQSVKLKEAKKYDPLGSLIVLQRLMELKRITIHPRCKNVYSQFISWKLENKKFDYTGMQEAILLILSELVEWHPFKNIMLRKPEYATKSEMIEYNTIKGEPYEPIS